MAIKDFIVKNGLQTPNIKPAGGANTLTVPATTGTIVTTGDSATVTNTMLAGSIANNKLSNSAVTIGTTAISLGGTSLTLSGLTSVAATTFTGALSGNASSVTNGVYTTGSYSDPSWLTISKSKVGLGSVENTALSTWAGTANVITLGTVTTGTWSATTIATNKGGTGLTTFTAANNAIYSTSASALTAGTLPIAAGGTGQTTKAAAFDALAPTTTVGDVIYHSGTDNVRLAGNTTTTPKFLQSTGTGAAAQAPTWATSTGTGSVVLAASPTLTGTINAASLILSGDLTVNGITTTVNTANLLVEDKNIELGTVAVPSDTTADGGGITLKGSSDKTFNWVNATDAWTSSQHLNLLSTFEYKINAASVLSATTLGSGVVNSSLTKLGLTSAGFVKTDASGNLTVDGSTYSVSSHTHNYAGSASPGGAASSVANAFVLKVDTGTVEGTDLFTFNGSAAKTFDIKAGTNVTLTNAAGAVTINVSNANWDSAYSERNRWDGGSGAWFNATTAKTSLGLNNVENTALSTWAGNSYITTVGTLASPTINTPAIKNTYVSSSATAISLSTINFAAWEGRLIGLTSSSAITITMDNSSVPVGTTLTFMQMGTGVVTITQETGVALLVENGLTSMKIRTRYSVVSITKVAESATDQWVVYGDIIP